MDLRSRFADLIDRGMHILDGHHRLDRIHHPEIRDSGNIDTDIVAGDDPLRLDRHRGDAQRHLPQPVDDRDDERQAGFSDTNFTRPSLNNTPFSYWVTTFTDSAKWSTPCTSIDRVDLIVLDSRRPRGPRRQRAGSTGAQAI